MNDPWWRRKRKKDPWYNEIHEELEKLGDLIDETMQKVFDTSGKTPVRHSRVKGFSLGTGSGKKSKLGEFDNLQPWEDDELGEEVEPLVDIVEDDDGLVVLAVLPGVDKDAINLRVTASCLTVSVDAADFEWYDELKLPCKVKPKSACASYKNGVLEVKFEKLRKTVRVDRISIKK